MIKKPDPVNLSAAGSTAMPGRTQPVITPESAGLPAQKARILVVDDHPMVREGLICLLSSQSDLVCCGETGTAAEALSAVARNRPDLVLLDLRLKGGDGLELIKSLKSQFADLRILVLSKYDSPIYVERALRAGALGYVVKDQAAEEVLNAIRVVLSGELYLTRSMAALLLPKIAGGGGQKPPRDGVGYLTDRELHVLRLLGSGLSTRQIASELNLSIKTIESHRENIKHKLGLRGAAELIHYANQWAQEHISLPIDTVQHASRRLDA